MIKRDTYQEVTDKLVAALEAETIPWIRPWRDGKSDGALPYNAVSGRAYNGINVLLLNLAPYAGNGWLTYKQARALGGSVRKGEHGTGIVYWNFKKIEEDGKTKILPLVKGYTVFNVEQCEGLDMSKLAKPEPIVAGAFAINHIAEAIGAKVIHAGSRALYAPALDVINIPSVANFRSEADYQSTLAHELVHWTGHEERLNRDFTGRFGSDAYAFEELVAEIGSAFTCARLGIELNGLQHPAYLANWLKVLKSDKRAIFSAASKAKQAAEFIFAAPAEDDESDERLAA